MLAAVDRDIRAAADTIVLRNATIPACLMEQPIKGADAEGLVRADLAIAGGRIAALAEPGRLPADDAGPRVDLDGGMVLPCFVDMHTHLDKGHIWARRPNPDGTFAGAIAAAIDDRTDNWTAEDLRRRMDFALRCAFAHGTAMMRTHLDSEPPHLDLTWPIFDTLRRDWHGRITLQAVALIDFNLALDRAALEDVAATVRRYDGVLGGFVYKAPHLQARLDRLFRCAADFGLDLDLHADETGDPQAVSLRAIAETALSIGFEGRIVVGHCCSLARQADDDVKRTLDLVAKAKITIVSLPLCNMYLQDRLAGRTPRWRGVTLAHEAAARGIALAIASDNIRDPFHAYGDLDMMEVYREATRILHFDHPVGNWPRSATSIPAAAMGDRRHGLLCVNAPADLICFSARSYSELLSRPQSDRIVIRGGRAIDGDLPDYRALDEPTNID